MMEASDITQGLLDRAGHGDVVARHELLKRFRQYLRSLVAVRLDRRVARRFDASDIVHEAVADRSERIPAVKEPPEVAQLRAAGKYPREIRKEWKALELKKALKSAPVTARRTK
jgi:hypothetical protein